jgi:cyclase
METARLIPCLDLDKGRVVKGVEYLELRDAGEPVELARRYSEEGADELVMLDITASAEKRATMLELVSRAAEQVFIPLTVGGGVASVDDARRLLRAGADKVAVNSAAVARPELISELAGEFGSQCVVLAIDAKKTGKSYEVRTHGGRRRSGYEVLAWAREGEERGAGELLVTSMDRDGTELGYDNELYFQLSHAVELPLVASGGVGNLDQLAEGYLEGGADGLLAASIFHFGRFSLADARAHLRQRGVPLRELSQ